MDLKKFNETLNEAAELPFWVVTAMDKENIEFTIKLWDCFVNHCKKLNMTLGATLTNLATFETKGNYTHEITFDTVLSQIIYCVLKDTNVEKKEVYRNITTCEDIDKAFEQIEPIFEGME